MTDSSVLTPPPPQPAEPERRGNGFGVTALVLGIVALVLGIIPFIGYGSWFLGLLAAIFGLVGVLRKNRPKLLAAIGLVIGVVAITVGLAVSISATAAVVSAVDKANNAVSTHTVVYSVTADSKTVAVTYSTYQNNKSESINKTFTAPFTKSISFTEKGSFNFSSFTLTAQSKSDSNSASATCSIKVDGKVVATESAKGAFATAACVGSK